MRRPTDGGWISLFGSSALGDPTAGKFSCYNIYHHNRLSLLCPKCSLLSNLEKPRSDPVLWYCEHPGGDGADMRPIASRSSANHQDSLNLSQRSCSPLIKTPSQKLFDSEALRLLACPHGVSHVLYVDCSVVGPNPGDGNRGLVLIY
jgi:hypothetical protein